MKIANFMFDELLEQVSASENVLESLIFLVKEKPYVRTFLESAVDDRWVDFDVDSIEYKKYGYHRSMAGALLLNRGSANVLNSILHSDRVAARAKLTQCKALLEMLHEGESNILTAILKKDLSALYPKITFEIINSALNNAK